MMGHWLHIHIMLILNTETVSGTPELSPDYIPDNPLQGPFPSYPMKGSTSVPFSPDLPSFGGTKLTGGMHIKNVSIKVHIPEVYKDSYNASQAVPIEEQIHIIAESIGVIVSSSPEFQKDGLMVNFRMIVDADNRVEELIGNTACDIGHISAYMSLAEIMTMHPDENYLVFFPCPLSVTKLGGLSDGTAEKTPVIEARFATLCNNYIGAFFAPDLESLYVAVTNALLRFLGSPLREYVSAFDVQGVTGDGADIKMGIKENILAQIKNSICFQNL